MFFSCCFKCLKGASGESCDSMCMMKYTELIAFDFTLKCRDVSAKQNFFMI